MRETSGDAVGRFAATWGRPSAVTPFVYTPRPSPSPKAEGHRGRFRGARDGESFFARGGVTPPEHIRPTVGLNDVGEQQAHLTGLARW